jgi:hypothetical protein
MGSNDKRHQLFLRALVLLGIICFAFFLAYEQGYVQLTLTNDRSYLSYVILAVYLVATGHWLYVSWRLSNESSRLAELEGADLDTNGDTASEVSRYFTGAREVHAHGGRYQGLLEAFGDRILNRHAAGHFVADTLLKLGLLGTIIGFILMLLPVAEIKEFEANLMQQLLGRMSEGMAVALYTTLAGLVTSTLLKLQYQILDSSAARLVTRVAELSELKLATGRDPSAA